MYICRPQSLPHMVGNSGVSLDNFFVTGYSGYKVSIVWWLSVQEFAYHYIRSIHSANFAYRGGDTKMSTFMCSYILYG
jgi:hypothetical protein